FEEDPVAVGGGAVDRAAEDVALLPQLDHTAFQVGEIDALRYLSEHLAHHSPGRTRRNGRTPLTGCRWGAWGARYHPTSPVLRPLRLPPEGEPGAVSRAARLRLLAP